MLLGRADGWGSSTHTGGMPRSGPALAAPLLLDGTAAAAGLSRPASPQRPPDAESEPEPAPETIVEVTLELPAEPEPAADGAAPEPWRRLGLRMRFPYVEAVEPHSPAAAARPELAPGLMLTAVRRSGDDAEAGGSWAEGVEELPEAEALALLGPDGERPAAAAVSSSNSGAARAAPLRVRKCVDPTQPRLSI